MAIENPKNSFLGAPDVKSFPKKQYEKIVEIITEVNNLIDGSISSTNLSLSGTLGVSGVSTLGATTPVTASAAGVLTVANTTASTTKDTGAVIVEGGVGIEKEIYAGLSINAGTYVTSGDGTVALPAIGPVSDPNTGMYSIGADRLGFAANGVKRLEVNTSGIGVVGYIVNGQIAPTNSNIDPAVKATMATSMLNGILTATPAGAIAYTLPTGTEMQTAAGTTIDVDQSIDFSIINIGAGGIITVTAAASFTIVGLATVAVNTSANFRIRKTAANTFVLYRMN